MRFEVLFRKIALGLLIMFAFPNLTQARVNLLPINVSLENGTRVEDTKLAIIDNEKFLNVNDLADFINAEIKWWPVSKKVALAFKGNKLEFFFNSSKLNLNEQKIKMKSLTKLIKGDLYIPLGFVLSSNFSRIIGRQVRWEKEAKILRFCEFPNILGVKIKKQEQSSLLILQTKQKLYYEVSKTDNKLIIEIFKGVLDSRALYQAQGDNLIIRTNLEQEKNKAVCYLEIPPNCEYHVTSVQNPCQIMVEVKGTGVIASTNTLPVETVPVITSVSTITVVSSRATVPQVLPVPAPEIKEAPSAESIVDRRAKIKTIVIDAGHGGKDPGAIGSYGTKEKDINLNIAFKLAELIHEKTDLKVILTRKEDVFIPLAQRTQIANDRKADLFVSIHCNSGLEKESKGFEIYFLSDRATDLEAEAVANIENSVIDLEDNSTVNDKLKAILWSLTLNEFVNDSSQLCSLIVNQVNGQNLELINRGVKQAGFFVLRGAKMPAVLVECAFLSNKREEKMLNKDRFCEKIAEAIFDGIMDYKQRKE